MIRWQMQEEILIGISSGSAQLILKLQKIFATAALWSMKTVVPGVENFVQLEVRTKLLPENILIFYNIESKKSLVL